MTKVCFVKCSPKYRKASESSQLLSTFSALWGGKRGAKSHILRNGMLSFPFLHSACFSLFFSTEFQNHTFKGVLWDIRVIFLKGIVETKRHIFTGRCSRLN